MIREVNIVNLINGYLCPLITDQPEIITHPVSTVIKERGDLLLTCNAVGNPTPSISWTKDGYLISVGGDPRITFTEQNANLSITNVSRSDDGEYRCVASNSLGNATSNASTVNVQCKYTNKEVVELTLLLQQGWSRHKVV